MCPLLCEEAMALRFWNILQQMTVISWGQAVRSGNSIWARMKTRSRRSVLVAALLEERLSWKSTHKRSMTQCQQAHASSYVNSEWKLGSSRVRRPQKAAVLLRLEWPCLKQSQKIVAIKAYLQMKNSKLITETTQPLTEREMAPDRAMQTLDH